jgi:UrcA family protein
MNTMTISGKLRRTILIATFSAALASSLVAVCTAADSTDAPQEAVKYGDLNVSNPQGAAVLYSRIRAAAGRVCERHDDRDLAAMQLWNSCVRKAIGDAVAKVNQPALSAIYNTKNGTSHPIIVATQSR